MPKRFSPEFKQQAVSYALANSDQSIAALAKHLGIGESTLDRCGVCQASCPISYAAYTTFLSNSLLSFDGFSQTSLTGFQLRTERFFQRSGLASLAVS